jgi:hypothetical protein
LPANSFLICLASPVLHKMLCGSFSESKGKRLKLDDVDGNTFIKILGVWCGREDCQGMGIDEVQQVASVADRFQMTEVLSAVEEALLSQLSIENCGEVLMLCGRCGMERLEDEALKIAAERFEEFATTAGFMWMGEEALGSVVDEDRLVARNEEAVWEAVLGWIKGAAGEVGGRGVVGKIRFPLMKEEYLGCHVLGKVGGETGEWIEGVVAEALRAKAARAEGAVVAFERLGRKALAHRVGLGVRWEEYRAGGELRLAGRGGDLTAIAACDGRICCGSEDGSIRVWSRASGEHERTLRAGADDAAPCVNAMAAWEGGVVSGHQSGALRVWNAATGACEQVLEVRGGAVMALAACGPRLASGSREGSVQLWATAGGARWACERTLLGRAGMAIALAGWQGKVASGSLGGAIWVWDAGTGARDATLAGHAGAVTALAAHGDRLLSASRDGTIRAWAMGTWAGLRTVEAYGGGTGLYPRSLAVSGPALVSGSSAVGGLQGEVRVWALEDLEPVHTLRQPAGSAVRALLAADGEVWGAVGRDVVVWGRKA